MPSDPLPAGPPRRAVLQLGLAASVTVVALGAAGCRLRVGSSPPAHHTDGGRAGPTPSATASPAADPDDVALGAADTVTQLLQQAYVAAARLRPDLAPRLGRLGTDVSAHRAALSALGVATPSATPPTTGFPALTAANATSVLTQIEQFASTSALQNLATVDGRTARLMASLAACSDAHVALLTRLPRRPPSAASR